MQVALRRVLSIVWVGVVPALVAGVVLRYLVPPTGTGLPGLVAVLGNRFELAFGVALFFLFSGLARYWRLRIPGGGHASILPAQLVAGEMCAARETGDAPRGRRGARVLESRAGAALSAHERREALSTVAAVVAAGLAALVIRSKVVEPYRVLSMSMLPTLETGDRIAGNKLAYSFVMGHAPHRGDVVVFRASAVALGGARADLPDVLVKRVVGLPGDEIVTKGDQVIINGWPVPACDAGEYLYPALDSEGAPLHGRLRVEFLDDRAYLTVHSIAASFQGPYRVKSGEVFVLGDNRGRSVDSRAWNAGHGGGVPFDAIEARAQWFLFGSHRSGDSDFGRLLRPLDRLQVHLRLEGVETSAAQEGIARCLRHPPANTRPPPPDASGREREKAGA